MEKDWFHPSGDIPSPREVSSGTWRQELLHTEAVEKHCVLASSASSLKRPRTTAWGITAHNESSPPTSTEKMHHKLVDRLVWWASFSIEVLSPKSSLCQVDVKPSSTDLMLAVCESLVLMHSAATTTFVSADLSCTNFPDEP